jgi:hypothetical protein
VLPSLGGRLLEWHARGRQWLAPPEPDSIWSVHPFSGGYTDFVSLGMYASRGWGEPYRHAWKAPLDASGRLTLTVTLEQDIRLSRTLWLQDGRLHIDSKVANRGSAPFQCGWGAALNLSLPTGGNVIFDALDGERVITWEALSQARGAALTLTGDQLPAGPWQVQAGEYTLHHTYQGVPLGRLSLGKAESPLRLAVDLRTEMLTLEPGQNITVCQVLWIDV